MRGGSSTPYAVLADSRARRYDGTLGNGAPADPLDAVPLDLTFEEPPRASPATGLEFLEAPGRTACRSTARSCGATGSSAASSLDQIRASPGEPTYLRFIGEDRYDALPAAVYVRGFVTAYARSRARARPRRHRLHGAASRPAGRRSSRPPSSDAPRLGPGPRSRR
jgi:hypothetical protein